MTVSDLKVLYIGPYKEDSDEGEICRQDIAAIHNDIDIVTRNNGRNNFRDPTWPIQLPDYESKPLDGITHIIQYSRPEQWERYGDYVHIGYLDITQDDISKEKWINNLQIVDQIWCSTRYAEHVVEKFYTGPIEIVPHAVDLNLYEKDYKISEIPQISGTYKFLCTSEPYTEKELRKIIQSFFEEFDPTEPVSLIIIGDSSVNNIIKSIKNELKLYKTDAYQKIVLTNKMTFAQKMGMYKYCDCYINSSNLSPITISQNLSTRHAIALGMSIVGFDLYANIRSDMRYSYKSKQLLTIDKKYLFNKEFCEKILGTLNQ